MKRLLPAIALLLLLVSCACEPEESTVDLQPYLSVRNTIANGAVWVMLSETETEFYLLPADSNRRWDVDEDGIYHVNIRISDTVSAVQNGDCMERIERISESRDIEIPIEHRITNLVIYKDGSGYVYSLGFFD